jgi:ABC-2 type transport system permease protein
MNGNGMSDGNQAGDGLLSRRARRQYAALASMRWQMFSNGLRSHKGMLELGARTFTYFVYGTMGLGLSVGLGFGAYGIVSSGHWKFLPILFWAVFLVWQLLPVMLASFQEQFDLGILLRFPVSFWSYNLLYLIFGLIDVSTITGGFCCLGMWVGITIARPGLSAWAALALGIFAAFNVLMVRAIFAWIDRWLAQRRSREIVGAVFLLLVLSLQLLNPALHQSRRMQQMSRDQRAASRRDSETVLMPWLSKANAVQRWLPPGLAAQAVRLAGEGQAEIALDSLGLVGMYGLIAGLALATRLRSEYAGESLGEAPSQKKVQRREGGWLPDNAGPISAVIEKEVRGMMRTLPLIYAIGAPLLLVLVFSGVFVRSGGPARTFELALPVCMIYAQIGLSQIFCNSLGAEGTGIQLYFLSPTPMRTVLLAKNIFHSLLFAVVALTAGVLATLRLGVPEEVVAAATAAWLLFALPCNLTAGNFFSLKMPYRVNPGRLAKQRGSQANQLVSVGVQLAVIAIGACVFGFCWWTGEKWLAVPIFLVLAAIATVAWQVGLGRTDALANRVKDDLIATLAKTG